MLQYAQEVQSPTFRLLLQGKLKAWTLTAALAPTGIAIRSSPAALQGYKL